MLGASSKSSWSLPCKFKSWVLLLFFFLATLCGRQDPSSLTRDRTYTPLQWKCGVLTTGLPGKPHVLYLRWPSRTVILNHLTQPWIFAVLLSLVLFFFFCGGNFMKFGLKGICGLSTVLKESLLTSLGGARRKPKREIALLRLDFYCRAAKPEDRSL